MITENDVRDALPTQGFLRDFVHYAWWCTDAHASYHLATGLACIAQTVPIEYHLIYGTKTHGNIFGLCVGPSGESRKSASISIARDVLEEALPGCMGEPPGSKENLVDTLREKPRQLIAYSEFGKFLADSEKGYLNPLRTTYTDAWDSVPLGRGLVSKKNTEAKFPRLSLLGGSTLAYLERYTEPADWTGGFLARFLTFYADRERTYEEPPSTVNPVQHAVRRDYMIQWLRWLAAGNNGFGGGGQCLGFDDAARRLWKEWYAGLEKKKEKSTEETRGLLARAHGHALRVALLLAWDYGGARTSESFYITPAVLEPTIKIIDLHLTSVVKIGENLASGKDMQDRRRVFNQITENPRPLGEIILGSRLLKDRVTRIIETLMAEGSIMRATGTAMFGEWYRRTTEAEQMALYRGPAPVVTPPVPGSASIIPISAHPDYLSGSSSVSSMSGVGVGTSAGLGMGGAAFGMSYGSGMPNSNPGGGLGSSDGSGPDDEWAVGGGGLD